MIQSIKKAVSYLWDIQVDYRESEINGDLIVFLSKGRYQLCTANAIYSFEDRYDNFANIFRDHLDFGLLPGQKVLVLGLGLGSVPITLDKVRPGSWEFTAVELDEAVCELASIYGYPKIISPIQTHVGDAIIFIENCQEQFDMICIDLFIDDIMPEDTMTIEFFNQIAHCLSPDGIVIANTLAFTEDHKKRSQAFFRDKFLKAFPKAVLKHTHLNNMLLSDKRYLLSDPTKKEV